MSDESVKDQLVCAFLDGELSSQQIDELLGMADPPAEEIEEDVEEEVVEETVEAIVEETEDGEARAEEETALVAYEDEADEDEDEEIEAAETDEADYEVDEESDDEDEDADLAEAYGAQVEHDRDAELDAEADAARAGVRNPREMREARIRLRREQLVADAPSIGPKTASRLLVVGVKTVGDLLELAPQEAAKKIKASHINAQVIRDWQSQALLACSVPGISGTVAQLLVGAGIYSPEDMLDADAEFLHEAILEYAESKEGQRLLRGAEPPDRDKVEEWIDAAISAIEDRAAA